MLKLWFIILAFAFAIPIHAKGSKSEKLDAAIKDCFKNYSPLQDSIICTRVMISLSIGKEEEQSAQESECVQKCKKELAIVKEQMENKI